LNTFFREILKYLQHFLKQGTTYTVTRTIFHTFCAQEEVKTQVYIELETLRSRVQCATATLTSCAFSNQRPSSTGLHLVLICPLITCNMTRWHFFKYWNPFATTVSQVYQERGQWSSSPSISQVRVKKKIKYRLVLIFFVSQCPYVA